MLHITDWDRIETVPDASVRDFLRERQSLLTDYDPAEEGGFIVVETVEEVTSEAFDFVGPDGLFSDLFGEASPFDEDFVSPFEYA